VVPFFLFLFFNFPFLIDGLQVQLALRPSATHAVECAHCHTAHIVTLTLGYRF